MRIQRTGSWKALIFASLFFIVAANAQTAKPGKTAGADDASRKQVIQKCRDSYYSLRALGLDEFQSTVQPNWEQVLKDQGATDPEALKAGLKLLNGLHFTMLLDQKGNVTMTHHTDTEPPNEQVKKGFEDIYSGINQATSGFFATWSLFMLTSPFPEAESDYKLDDLGTQYRLSYKDGASDVVTLIGKDLAVREITVDTAEFNSVIKPQLSKTASGFMLAGYEGDYTPKAGKGAVHLNVKINHAPVNGMQLPVTLIADTSLDGTPSHMELAFADYQIKKH